MLKASSKTEGLSIKVGISFSKLGLSANAWTLISIIPALAGFIALVYGQLIPGALFFILSGFIDVIDGAVARVTGTASAKGAFLDGIIDRYVELMLYLGLLAYCTAFVPEIIIPHAFWFALLIFGAFMPTFARAYADHRQVVTEPEDHKRMGGVMERAERLIVLFAGMFIAYFDPLYLIFAVILVAILGNVTALQRIAFVLRFKEKGV